jgi:threonine synthase
MDNSYYICTKCSREYDVNLPVWQCECGGLLDLEFTAKFDIKKISSRKPNLWRYREALPIKDDMNIISFEEGFTPLISIDFDGNPVWIKQDHLFPTGSYKDRGATVLLSKVHELGVHHVVEDSSGNAGCAIAAYSARAGCSCEIFVPSSTSPAKLAQIIQYGATLTKIPGSRENTARAVLKKAQSQYYASHSWNPYFFQGTKTFAYEIWEQLGWRVPDKIILPVGNGTLLLGTWIGFNDLLKAGMIERVPELIAVQTSNCAPLALAFQNFSNEPLPVDSLATHAEGIAIAEPIRGQQILSAVRQTKGSFITVDDPEIVIALLQMHRKGFYIEPTSAAVIAALKQIIHQKKSEAVWVSVFTGHGLKSTEKILKFSELDVR